jgi:hypothetical protein
MNRCLTAPAGRLWLAACLLLLALPAIPAPRQWALDEFSRIELSAKEARAPANNQPLRVDAAALQAQLAAVRLHTRDGEQPLFGTDELALLVPALVQALAAAGPDDDVLLLSTARRSGGFDVPLALSARLFMQGEALQFIVHEARRDFIAAYRRTRLMPRFAYGSRNAAGGSQLSSATAESRRADWVAMPVSMPVAAPVPAPVSALPPSAAPPASAAAPGQSALERRLRDLKRLLEQALISDDEYQALRRDALQKL